MHKCTSRTCRNPFLQLYDHTNTLHPYWEGPIPFLSMLLPFSDTKRQEGALWLLNNRTLVYLTFSQQKFRALLVPQQTLTNRENMRFGCANLNVCQESWSLKKNPRLTHYIIVRQVYAWVVERAHQMEELILCVMLSIPSAVTQPK